MLRNVGTYLGLNALLLLTVTIPEIFPALDSFGEASIVMFHLLTFMVQKAEIFNVDLSKLNRIFGVRPQTGLVSHMLRYIVTVFLALSVSAVVSLAVILGLGFSAKSLLFVVVFAVLFVGAQAAVLALAGTWLPAAIHGHASSLSSAISRGKVGFLSRFFRIALALVVPLVLTLAVILSFPGDAGLLFFAGGRLNIALTAGFLLLTLVQSFAVTYVALLLARQYIDAARPDVASLRP
ncbi:hypothetical protein [Ensifer soli]|uniref:hypothetical protein n=1 Tax=Ciceribacter sp. sgz301302 TaxID=3342379 RepID=UPI0035B74550